MVRSAECTLPTNVLRVSRTPACPPLSISLCGNHGTHKTALESRRKSWYLSALTMLKLPE
jgi:hypothetical protein